MPTSPIHVVSRRRSADRIRADFPDATIVDVTSRGAEPWVQLSPFYPVGGLPVPGMPDHTSASVEGVWQGLKVFEHADVDPSRFDVDTMRGLKRTVRRFGPVRGHRLGDRLLGYVEARQQIYLPTYRVVLAERERDLVERIRGVGELVLLDYTTNGDLTDPRAPLSHAALIARWLRDDWPH
ncbi:hypothetical protein [Cellulomonas sp. NPDC089187]|uniref:DUF6939 family protein n=1 Tax=Cellulomonas sp. NPDC089187 TaxID=3154970 RepID=UPI003421066C